MSLRVSSKNELARFEQVLSISPSRSNISPRHPRGSLESNRNLHRRRHRHRAAQMTTRQSRCCRLQTPTQFAELRACGFACLLLHTPQCFASVFFRKYLEILRAPSSRSYGQKCRADDFNVQLSMKLSSRLSFFTHSLQKRKKCSHRPPFSIAGFDLSLPSLILLGDG